MLKNKEDSDVVFNSFFHNIICEYSDLYSDKEIEYVCKFVNFNNVPNRIIFDNERIQRYINWNSLDKMCLVRIIVACIDRGNDEILDKVNVSNFNYKIDDIKFLIMRRPELIENFNFDLKKIGLDDAYTLLSLGQSYFLDKINIEKYDFNPNQIHEIIKAYKYSIKIGKRLKLSKLKSNHIVDIVLNSEDDEYYEILNMSLLNTLEWIKVLKKKRFLIKKCNLDIFKKSDVFHSIKLCELFKDDNNKSIFNLIHERDKSEITSFGWEKLIINNYNEFIYCLDYSKLNELSIKNIRKQHENFNT